MAHALRHQRTEAQLVQLRRLRLPHSLSLAALDEVADYYWSGKTVEEFGLTFMNEPWQEPPVIEALYQGALEPGAGHQQSGWLPGFR